MQTHPQSTSAGRTSRKRYKTWRLELVRNTPHKHTLKHSRLIERSEPVDATASQEEEENVTTEEPSSTESPVDVTSQEEEDNTAAEETSIEEDVPEETEPLTASEEVQEAIFDNAAEQAEQEEEEATEEEVTGSEEGLEDEVGIIVIGSRNGGRWMITSGNGVTPTRKKAIHWEMWLAIGFTSAPFFQPLDWSGR